MKRLILLTFFSVVFALGFSVHAELNVVATLPDLAAVAREIGGEKIKLTALAQASEDPHYVDAKPSFIRGLNRADLLIQGGAELETGWLPPLVQNARNGRILPGSPGNLIASRNLRLLEIPTGPLDRSQGDVHASGNPHYLLDPLNARIVARDVAETLSRLDPANAASYAANARRFHEEVEKKLAEWNSQLRPHRGTKVLTYHKSFDYLLHRFELELAGTIEPKPGVDPSPTHINSLIPKAREQGVALVLIEPNRPMKTPNYVAESIGAKVVSLPLLPPSHAKPGDYIAWIDTVVERIAAALNKAQ